MAITFKANDALPFWLVSDGYSASEVKGAINSNCSDVAVGEPVPLNSKWDVQATSLVQLYRGDSAAVFLLGYNNTKESPGSPYVVPNPPFPPSVNMTTWVCLNLTIGESIPLLNAASSLTPSIFMLWCFLLYSFLRSIV